MHYKSAQNNLAQNIADELEKKLSFPAVSNTATGSAPAISKAIIGNLKKIAGTKILGPYKEIPRPSELVELIAAAISTPTKEAQSITPTAQTPSAKLKALVKGFGEFCADAITIRERMLLLMPKFRNYQHFIDYIDNPSKNAKNICEFPDNSQIFEYTCAIYHYQDYLQARLNNASGDFKFPDTSDKTLLEILKNEEIAKAVERRLRATNSKDPLPMNIGSELAISDLANKIRGELSRDTYGDRDIHIRDSRLQTRGLGLDIRSPDKKLLGILFVFLTSAKGSSSAPESAQASENDIERELDIYPVLVPYRAPSVDSPQDSLSAELDFWLAIYNLKWSLISSLSGDTPPSKMPDTKEVWKAILTVYKGYPSVSNICKEALLSPKEFHSDKPIAPNELVMTIFSVTQTLNRLWGDLERMTSEEKSRFAEIITDYKAIQGARIGILEFCSILSLLFDARGSENIQKLSDSFGTSGELLYEFNTRVAPAGDNPSSLLSNLRERLGLPRDMLPTNDLAQIALHVLLSGLSYEGRASLYELVKTNKLVIDTIKSSPIKALNSIPLEELQNKLAEHSSQPMLFSDPVWDDWQVVEE
jgi:hypothetical protein